MSRNGKLTKQEISALGKLLKKVPAIPSVPEEFFISLMRKNVPAVVDLAIIRNHKILLTYRDDVFYRGWHFPGGLIHPRETFKQTASRILLKEVGLKLAKIEKINTFNNSKDKRFHCLSIFFICRLAVGEPIDGKWFSDCPKDIIPEHKRLWSNIKPHVKNG